MASLGTVNNKCADSQAGQRLSCPHATKSVFLATFIIILFYYYQKKLHLLRRAEKGDNPWKFTEKLIKEIKFAKNYQAVEDIRQTIQDW